MRSTCRQSKRPIFMCKEQYFTTKLPRNGWPVCGAGLGAFSHLSRLAHAHSPPLYRITAVLCFNLQVKELADLLTNNEFTS